MPQSFDGKLAYRKWDEEPEVWSYAGPFSAHMEQLTQQALTSVHMTREEITTYVRPVLAQVAAFRPRQGYPTVQDRQARVEDIVNAPRRLDANATWYSGGPAGMLGGSRYMSNNLGLA
jgi:hypothetical protein